MFEEEKISEKTPRFRSPPYPALPLNRAMDRAMQLYGKALHHSVPISVAGNAWEYGIKSSGLFATVAALKQFGLLTDEGSGDKRRLKLTDLAIRLARYADPNSEKRRSAIRSAALAPKIHAELWEKYGAAGASGAMDVVVKSYLTADRADDGEAAYSAAAADELVQEYRQTMSFSGWLDSNAPFAESEELLSDSSAPETLGQTTQDDQKSFSRPLPLASASKERAIGIEEALALNDIRVEFSGGKMRINALLDSAGLEELEKKIAAYKVILS
jgi:hypothetical protein